MRVLGKEGYRGGSNWEVEVKESSHKIRGKKNRKIKVKNTVGLCDDNAYYIYKILLMIHLIIRFVITACRLACLHIQMHKLRKLCLYICALHSRNFQPLKILSDIR